MCTSNVYCNGEIMADLQTKRIQIAKHGVNKRDNPIDFAGDFTPYMKNFHIEGGVLKKFSGYSKFPDSHMTYLGVDYIDGYVLSSDGESEDGRRLVEFTNARGETYLVAITEKHAFAYNLDSSDGSRWRNISPGTVLDFCTAGWTDAHASITVSHPANDFRLKMDADTTISGDSSKITYKNIAAKDITGYSKIGLWVTSYVTSGTIPLQLVVSESADGAKAGTYITLDLSAKASDNGNRMFVVLSGDFSGLNTVISLGIWNNNADWNSNDWVKIDSIVAISEMDNDELYVALTEANDTNMFSSGNALILSNNSEDLYFWDATPNAPFSNPFETLVHTFPNFQYCREVVEFYNYFMMINYVTGSLYRKSIEHSGAGDMDDHSSISSGNYWLSDATGKLLKAIKLENYLMVFSEHSILLGAYYGSAAKFTFKVLANNFGLIGSNAICVVGNTVFFIGSDRKFYIYNLNSSFEEIGRPISEDFFSWGALGATSTTDDIKVCFDRYSQRVYFFSMLSKYLKSYALNLRGQTPAWEYYEFPDEDSINNEVNIADMLSTTAIAYEGAHSKQNSELATIFLSCSYPSPDSARTYRLHNPDDVNTSFLADESEIECEYQTEDVSINDELEYARFQEFIFTAKSSLASSSVNVEYSVDNGNSWSSVEESPIYLENDEWKTYQCHLDKVSRVIRFRFTNTSKDLQIKNDMFVRFMPEGVEGID